MTSAMAAAAARRPTRSATTLLLVGGAVGLALFGSFLLVLTPSLGHRPGLQTLWVLFSLVLLKLPLLALVWWLIVRRRSRRTDTLTSREVTALVRRVEGEIESAGGAPARPEDLSATVWAAVGRAGDGDRDALVGLALRLDRIARRAGRGAVDGRIRR